MLLMLIRDLRARAALKRALDCERRVMGCSSDYMYRFEKCANSNWRFLYDDYIYNVVRDSISFSVTL